MLCKHPFIRDPRTGRVFKLSRLAALSADKDSEREFLLQGTPFPCGQCLPCRINRRRIWTHRLMLEYLCNPDAVFLTLTYRDEDLPDDARLCKRDLQRFIKAVRNRYRGRKRQIRYYACGEYGERTYRPHYHAILFGVYQHEVQEVSELWSYGGVFAGTFSKDSAQYVAGYVCKKLTKKEDPKCAKEFAIMSLKPGIGYPALDKIQELMKVPAFRHMIRIQDDVPSALMHGRSLMPFGRYLRNKLRELLDTGGDLDAFYADVRQKYEDAISFGKTLLEKNESDNGSRIAQLERRYKIFNKRNAI